jgi:hypothetical protein
MLRIDDVIAQGGSGYRCAEPEIPMPGPESPPETPVEVPTLPETLPEVVPEIPPLPGEVPLPPEPEITWGRAGSIVA